MLDPRTNSSASYVARDWIVDWVAAPKAVWHAAKINDVVMEMGNCGHEISAPASELELMCTSYDLI